MDVIAFTPAAQLARMVHEKKIGCIELLERVIARIERLEGTINAIIVRDFERAWQAARALDSQPRSGPLHGVAITVKKSFDVAGLPTTWGYPDFRDNTANEDAISAQRLNRLARW